MDSEDTSATFSQFRALCTPSRDALGTRHRRTVLRQQLFQRFAPELLGLGREGSRNPERCAQFLRSLSGRFTSEHWNTDALRGLSHTRLMVKSIVIVGSSFHKLVSLSAAWNALQGWYLHIFLTKELAKLNVLSNAAHLAGKTLSHG